MKLYFCDKCNESIPLADIRSNHIAIDQGKIYCKQCAPKPVRARSPLLTPTAAVIMLLCFGLGGVVVAMLSDLLFDFRPPKTLTDRVGRLETALHARAKQHDDEIAVLKADLLEVPDAHGRAGLMARIMQDMQRNAATLEQVRHSLNGLSDDLRSGLERVGKSGDDGRLAARKEADDLRTTVERLSGGLEHLAGRVGAAEASLSELSTRLSRAETQRVATPSAPEGAATGSAPAPSSGGALSAEDHKNLEAGLALIKDREAAKRFQGIFEMATVKSRRVDEALIEALADEVSFVRSTAVDTLAERGTKWAIPHIIPKLKDSDSFVRAGAITALEKLMGRSIGLKANATPAQYLAKISELERWWVENKDSFIARD